MPTPITTQTKHSLARKIIYEHLDEEVRGPAEDHLNIFELGADELDVIEIVIQLEDQFGLEMPDKDYNTVKDFLMQF